MGRWIRWFQSLHLLLVLTVFCCGAPAASAQEVAHSFEQLQTILVLPQEQVELTHASGEKFTGTLTDLTSSALTLLADGEARRFQDFEVRAIRQRRQDSVRNGALWGLGIGAGIGAVGALVSDFWGSDPGLVFIQIGVNAGLGAAVGMGIDALTRGHRVIYEQRPVREQFTVTPLFQRGQKGFLALVELDF